MFAFSGVLNRPPGEKRDPAFLEYAVSLVAGDGKKRICFIPTATGDSPSAIEAVTEVFAGREDVDFSVLTLFTQPSVPDIQAHLTAQVFATLYRVMVSPSCACSKDVSWEASSMSADMWVRMTRRAVSWSRWAWRSASRRWYGMCLSR